ncbi:unnamed protein product, partial [Cylicostephanus goldi]
SGSSESYWYTAQGGDSKIPTVDDRQEFLEALKALDVLGFNQEKQRDIFRVLKCILLLGNIQFNPNGDGSTIAVIRIYFFSLRKNEGYSSP